MLINFILKIVTFYEGWSYLMLILFISVEEIVKAYLKSIFRAVWLYLFVFSCQLNLWLSSTMNP